MAKHPDHPAFEYSQIIDGIFLGTNVCCAVHFDERLLKLGITVDISLEKERLDSPYGVASYLWQPVEDNQAPTPEQFEVGVRMLESCVALGLKVYVHCTFGHGRSPTLVAAYLIRAKGMTPTEAEAFLQARRPGVHLTLVQREALEAFAGNQ